MIDFQSTWWPADQERLTLYAQLDQMFLSKHREAFARLSGKLPKHLYDKAYISQDYPKFISSTWAGLLFGRPPVISTPIPAEQSSLNTIMASNRLAQTFYESELACSSRGDAVLRLSTGSRHPGGPVEVLIEEVPAYSYFAECDPDNQRRILSQCLAWERTVGEGDKLKRYLRVEHHGAGWIRNELYPITGLTKVGPAVPLSVLYGEDAPPDYIETGVSVPLLFHLPNELYGCAHYGMSDYTPTLVGLFDEANQRITGIADVLDRHKDPKLILPTGVLDRRGQIKTEDLEIIEVAPEDASSNAPRLLTWDAQLDSSFKMLDEVDSAILKFAQISAAWARQDAGNIDSAPAFNRCFAQMLARLTLKQSYREPVIKQMLFTAMQLNAIIGLGPAPTAPPEVLWSNGLPKDDKEMTEVAAAAVGAGFMSKLTAIRYTRQVGEAEAMAELARIDEERADDPPLPTVLPMQPDSESSGTEIPS